MSKIIVTIDVSKAMQWADSIAEGDYHDSMYQALLEVSELFLSRKVPLPVRNETTGGTVGKNGISFGDIAIVGETTNGDTPSDS